MDNATVVVIVIFVMVLMFFGFTILGDAKTTGKATSNVPSYSGQQYGGGCGR